MRPSDVVAAMWQAMQGRDWAAVRAVLPPDLVVEWPANSERIVGAERFVMVSEVEVPHAGVGVFRTVGVWTVRHGRIVHGREYWKRVGEDPSPGVVRAARGAGARMNRTAVGVVSRG